MILEKGSHPTWDYFKLLLFVVFLAELVLFFMAIIFGRLIDYDKALTACFWIGIIVAASFFLIVLLNLIVILFQKLFQLMNKKGFMH